MFRGIFTPVITVLDEKQQLDFAGNELVINRLIENQVDGLLFLGSIGEFFALTLTEKKQLIRFAIQTVNKRKPVFIGTGSTVQEEVLELTRFAEQEGADAVVVVSPYYLNYDEDTIYRYYASVARATSLPILLYNFPERTTSDLGPELVLRLVKDFPNIVGIKDTVNSASHPRSLILKIKELRPDFSILSGYDEYLVSTLMAGGDGVLCGLTNVIPEVFVKLWKAYEANDLAAVAAAQKTISFLTQLYDVASPFITSVKGAVMLRGVSITPAVKEPAAPLTEEQLVKLKQLLVSAGVEKLK